LFLFLTAWYLYIFFTYIGTATSFQTYACWMKIHVSQWSEVSWSTMLTTTFRRRSQKHEKYCILPNINTNVRGAI